MKGILVSQVHRRACRRLQRRMKKAAISRNRFVEGENDDNDSDTTQLYEGDTIGGAEHTQVTTHKLNRHRKRRRRTRRYVFYQIGSISPPHRTGFEDISNTN